MFGRLKSWLRRHQRGTLECFIVFLGKSQLCTEQQIDRLVSSFEREHRGFANGDVVDRFCNFLVDKNAVTAWQCDKLKAGKIRGFYLDDYLLLEVVGQDNTSRSYRARDLRDGTTVRLVVTPKERQSSYLEYRVERSIEK
jgi:hypothetical protein